ncbi:BGN_3a_G0019520.mRNA.1.CDS.1 [Saccharomyces cerevisiae]|nr:BGN_3a_G0019520.mRNA.1.CDS.1 [Saccharomyces cerevisiae]CAI7118950.1 BGN_3a_G0019520.mRNA.1.CDS.1 [Saccharomyces cerevisiae]
MSRKLSHLIATRKSKTIVVTVLLIYSLLTFHLSNKRLLSQFYPSKDDFKQTLLPTTSHSQDINLKKQITVNKKKNQLHNLRDQLSFAFPYDFQVPIPQRVWQTWKVGADDKNFPSSFRTYQKTWSGSYSPDYQYSLISDDSIIPFLENLYAPVPIVIQAFKLMPGNILKADFLRYLLLFARGGIYSDMDTMLLKPIDSWPSQNKSWLNNIIDLNKPIPYKNSKPSLLSSDEISHQPGLVIGIEADPDRDDWSEWYARRIQFCQWTIQAKPGHPILRELILNITATTLASVQNPGVPVSEMIDPKFEEDYNVNYRHKRRHDETYKHSELKNNKNVDGSDIMNWTGPGIFSDIIFEYMNNVLRYNSDILLINPNLNKNDEEGSESATTPAKDVDNDTLSKSTRKFYKKISESLQSSNSMPWEFFSFLKEPVIVDDVMVLPITSFSPDVGQMGAQSSDDKMAFVKHMFSGSWKEDADKNAGHK